MESPNSMRGPSPEASALPSDARALSMGLMVALNHVVADDLHRTYMESAKQCLRKCANEIERTEACFQGVMKDNADLAAEIKTLDEAVARVREALAQFTSEDVVVMAKRARDEIESRGAALELFIKQWDACGPNSDFGRYFSNVRDAAEAAIHRAVQS